MPHIAVDELLGDDLAPLARAPKVAKEPNAKDELLPPKSVKPPPAPPPPHAQGDLF